jgi:hypothetical protein
MAEPLLAETPQSQLMSVVVPPDHPLNEALLIQAPSGEQFEIEIPEGTLAGATINVRY